MPGRIPADTVVYAIGDIHGRLDLLERIHARIADDAKTCSSSRRLLIYLGDYVSRGADSPGVVERVRRWLPAGFERITLKGNHEDLLLRYLAGELDAGNHWFDYGGLDTLASYGVRIPDRALRNAGNAALLRNRFAVLLPPAHLEFFRSLPVRYQCGDYLFVHGGVRPGVPLAVQTDQDCMWIRKPFLESTADHGAVIVHGHSIGAEPEARCNRIGIDTGAYRSGILTCVVLEGNGYRFLQTGKAPDGALRQ